jgi:hypothetical protein
MKNLRPTPLGAALDLAARGLPIFPLHFPMLGRGALVCSCGRRDCSNAAKHPFAPLAPHGVKDATTDQRQIEKSWRQHPQLNVGVVTDSLLVLDIDPRHRGYEGLAALEEQHDTIPHTWAVRTGGGGLHIYLRPPNGSTIGNSAGKLGPGLDVRAKGGYVVAPPSRHISGTPYEWIFSPDEAPLAATPMWLSAAMVAERTHRDKPTRPLGVTTRYSDLRRSSTHADTRIVALLLKVARAQNGERNQLTFWAACTVRDMVREGAIDHAAGMDALAQLHQAAAHAGLGPREITSTISSALRRSA